MLRKSIKFLIIFGIIGTVIYLFASGTFSASEARNVGRSTYYKGKGKFFGLIKGPDPVQSAHAAAKCRDNLKRLERAKRKAAEGKDIGAGFITLGDVQKAYGAKLPACPEGGRYTIGPMLQLPMCSIGGHGTPQQQDDHLIHGF